jgi:hypothetical protein
MKCFFIHCHTSLDIAVISQHMILQCTDFLFLVSNWSQSGLARLTGTAVRPPCTAVFHVFSSEPLSSAVLSVRVLRY